MVRKAKRDGKGRGKAGRGQRLRGRLEAAERRVAKRWNRLAEAIERRDALSARLAAQGADGEAVDAPPAGEGVAEASGDVPAETSPVRETADAGEPSTPLQAFCLRERRRVEIRDPAPIVLGNGRHAIAGTCPSCGARVVRTGPWPF